MLAGIVAGVAGALYLVLPWSAPPPDVLTGSVSREVTSGPLVDIEPALSTDGHTIAYVADDGAQQSIWMVETRGGLGTPWTKKPGRHRHPAWAPDGRIFFESGENGRRGIYVAPEFDSEKAVLVVPGGREPAVSRDGTLLAFVTTDESGNQRIGVTGVDNYAMVRRLTGDGDGRWDHVSPAWSPDGRWICYGAADGLWLVPSDGSGKPRPVSHGTVDAHPAWSGSGHIYFSSMRGGVWQLWRVTRDGRVPERVTGGIGIERMPALSRDGRVLVFSTADDRSDIVIRHVATGEEHPIGGGDMTLPSFSPDSRAIYLLLSAWNRKNLWVQPLAGGVPSGTMRPLAVQPVSQAQTTAHSQPAASPDGRWVAFLEIKGDSREIFVVSVAGGTPVNITNHPAADYLPAWSPDSSRLAFVSERDGEQHVWVQAVDDGKPVGAPARLTRGTAFEQGPSWSPDGRSIAFVTGSAVESEVAIARVGRPSVPAIVTAGSLARRVRWLPRRGWLLICGQFSPEGASIRAFDPARGAYVPAFPEVALGPGTPGCVFDISPDERLLALGRVRSNGRIGVLEARSGVY